MAFKTAIDNMAADLRTAAKKGTGSAKAVILSGARAFASLHNSIRITPRSFGPDFGRSHSVLNVPDVPYAALISLESATGKQKHNISGMLNFGLLGGTTLVVKWKVAVSRTASEFELEFELLSQNCFPITGSALVTPQL